MNGLMVGSIYFLVVCVLGIGLLAAAFNVGASFRAGRDGFSSFECGFQSMSSARVPFSLKFYLLAIIFLLFDVELVLIFPYFMGSTGPAGFFLFLFFSILLWGLVHECNEMSLEWGV
uniref:NADH-ubiquinone oxidoreductase chain 3 n=1 Tax=Vasticardium flavum TaxID=80826 RepID=A0A516IDH8_9BIVA|nr:NADH dehydrogenase subunit 3 [Vasticardium flavum]